MRGFVISELLQVHTRCTGVFSDWPPCGGIGTHAAAPSGSTRTGEGRSAGRSTDSLHASCGRVEPTYRSRPHAMDRTGSVRLSGRGKMPQNHEIAESIARQICRLRLCLCGVARPNGRVHRRVLSKFVRTRAARNLEVGPQFLQNTAGVATRLTESRSFGILRAAMVRFAPSL